MTASKLRVVRRSNAPLVASLTAAAAPVEEPSRLFTSTPTKSELQWQEEAWRYTHCIGELGYFVRWRSNACAQARLVASAIDEDTGMPTGSIDEKDARGQEFVQLVKDMAGGPLGQKALIKRAAAALTVPGEFNLCILQRPEGERWYVIREKDILRSQSVSDQVEIKLPDGKKHLYRKGSDAMIRIWNEDFEDPSKPDSPVRAALDILGEIERATKKIRKLDRSRILNAGLIVVPSEASLPDPQGPTSTSVPGQPKKVAGSLQQALVKAATTADENDDSITQVVPIVIAGPGDHIGKIAHVDIGSDATKTSIDIRTDSVARLARSLDTSPERLLGMGENSNHWSSYQVADEDVKLHIEPPMEVLCHGIYEHVLAPKLESMGINSSKYTLWFDTSRITADPDLTDEVKVAYDAGTVQSSAFVKQMGLPEDALYDFTTDEGRAQWARDRVSEDPSLLPMLAQMIPEFESYSFEQSQLPVDPYADPNADPDIDPNATVTPEQAATDEPDTERNDPPEPAGLAASAAYNAVRDVMVNRVLELAASRRVHTSDRATFARIRAYPKHERHRHLPPVDPREVEALVRGWHAIVTPEFAKRHGIPIDQLRASVLRRVTAELTAAQVNAQGVNGAPATHSPLQAL